MKIVWAVAAELAAASPSAYTKPYKWNILCVCIIKILFSDYTVRWQETKNQKHWKEVSRRRKKSIK